VRRAFLVLLLALTSCSSATNVFNETPTSTPSAHPAPAQLDRTALAALLAQLGPVISTHRHGYHLDLGWGAGASVAPAGPYAHSQPVADLLATISTGDVGGAAQSTADELKGLSGPQGATYLLITKALHRVGPSLERCAQSQDAAVPIDCRAKQISDGIFNDWFARDTKTYFHVGDTTTVYRPVDAFSAGCALVVAGFAEHELPPQPGANQPPGRVEAGDAIIKQQMHSAVDQHFGFVAGLLTATNNGGVQTTDFHASVADQAGIAEMLLQAFDTSREQTYLADAAAILQPLLDERVSVRGSKGYFSGFDLQGSGQPDNTADLEAGLLVLEAAHHYDRDDGNRFARVEEKAAQVVLGSVPGLDPAQGLPVHPGEARSGIVTALAVIVLGEVLRPAVIP
jgi:hypothetical protein